MRAKGWLIIAGGIVGGLFLLGAVGAAMGDDSSSYTPSSGSSGSSGSSSSYDSSDYSSTSIEESYVATSCETAMSDPDIASGYATGIVSAYDLASAFANGYVPSSDGNLTRSEVISACLRGIRRS